MSAIAASPRRAAIGVAAVSLAGKLLAIAKTVLIAGLFGASLELDAFWVAYTLPTLLPGVLTSVVTVAFVPRFMASLEGRTGPDAWRGANTLFTAVMAIALLATVAIWFGADALVRALAPGLEPAGAIEAARLTRLMTPAIPALTLIALLTALSNAHERFLLPTMEGVVTNLVLIVAAIAWTPRYGVAALAVGVVAGFVAQAAILATGGRGIIRANLRPALALRHPDFTAPLGHMLPLLVGSVGAALTALVNQYFVSRLDAGAISALAFATMLAFLPVEVFAQAILTTYYPALGRAFAQRRLDAAARAHGEATRFTLLLTLPAAAALWLCAEPIVALLLQRGRFDADAAASTSGALAWLSFAIAFRALAYLNYRVLHAALRPWTQVGIGLAGIATNIGLIVLMLDSLGLVGVALATTASMAQSALLSHFAVRRVLGGERDPSLPRELAKVVVATAALLAAAALARAAVAPLFAGYPLHYAALIELGVAGLAGTAAGLAVALALRQPDLKLLYERFARR
ncbi:MAG TPA: lipid II flippase MurJ [Xanthomonadales bacterium]|nr:lipid II flippase MurJ [Xanthomonadales bacterium]